MIKRITLLLFILASTISFGQFGQGPVGHLTIFSEDGDPFQLILNGELQNDIPQTNLRIEDLNQPYYNAKVVFADKSLLEISKNNLMITDVDGVFQDVTYKIKRDKNNHKKMKMNFFSMIPVRQGYVAPSNIYVMHYGQPREVIVTQANPETINQTTTTTTTQTGGNNVGIGVNIGGINMGVSIKDDMGGGVVSQTTTTTTHSNTGYSNNNQHNQHNQHNQQNNTPRGCAGRYAMGNNDFSNAVNTIKNQGFDDTKLKIAKQIASVNCLNINQITQIANTFGFEESKLEFAKYAYDYCVEPRNYFNLNNIFSFSSSVDELTDYIQSRK